MSHEAPTGDSALDDQFAILNSHVEIVKKSSPAEQHFVFFRFHKLTGPTMALPAQGGFYYDNVVQAFYVPAEAGGTTLQFSTEEDPISNCQVDGNYHHVCAV